MFRTPEHGYIVVPKAVGCKRKGKLSSPCGRTDFSMAEPDLGHLLSLQGVYVRSSVARLARR